MTWMRRGCLLRYFAGFWGGYCAVVRARPPTQGWEVGKKMMQYGTRGHCSSPRQPATDGFVGSCGLQLFDLGSSFFSVKV
jgi:hypothetical protein